jgi:ABC-type phosphate transport system substrate-binding protein
MDMKRTLTILGFLASLALPAAAAPASAPPAAAFKVVVNGANGVSSMTKEDVSKLFLKKVTSFPGGQAAMPVDQTKDSAVRKAFSTAVLGKDVSTVDSYWQQAIFSGRATPPAEKPGDNDVLAFVRANPGAIGYVSGRAELGASVKELTVN